MLDRYIEIDAEVLIAIVGFVGCISLLASLII
jgi:hypothetical protein